MSFNLNWKTTIKVYLISILISILLGKPINNMVFNMALDICRITKLNFSPFFFIFIFIYFAMIMFPIILFHESLHALAYLYLGGKVRFGFKGIYVYCQEILGIKISRTQFLIVLMAPVTVISLISMLLPYRWGLIVYILNLLGSSGDIYMALWLCRIGDDKRIVDKSYGFDVI